MMDVRTEAEGDFAVEQSEQSDTSAGCQWIVREQQISRQMHEARGVESKGQRVRAFRSFRVKRK